MDMKKPTIALELEDAPSSSPMKGGRGLPLGGADDEEAEGEDPIGEVSEGETAAAKAAMSAFKSGDAVSFAKAMKGFIKLCGGY